MINFLKIGLILTIFTLFIFACTQPKNANTIAGSNSVAENNNSVIASNTTANTNAQPSAANDELASASKIYSEKCVKCHKEDGTGGVTVFEDGTKVKAPNFTSDRQKKNPDSDYIKTIENGAKEDGMPAFKDKISDDDIKNLVKYIRREFQSK